MKKIVLSLLAGSMLASYALPTYVSASVFLKKRLEKVMLQRKVF